MTTNEMKKVTITKKDGSIGVLTKSADGKWNISLNGVAAPSSAHYVDAQVERIIAQSQAQGSKVEVE